MCLIILQKLITGKQYVCSFFLNYFINPNVFLMSLILAGNIYGMKKANPWYCKKSLSGTDSLIVVFSHHIKNGNLQKKGDNILFTYAGKDVKIDPQGICTIKDEKEQAKAIMKDEYSVPDEIANLIIDFSKEYETLKSLGSNEENIYEYNPESEEKKVLHFNFFPHLRDQEVLPQGAEVLKFAPGENCVTIDLKKIKGITCNEYKFCDPKKSLGGIPFFSKDGLEIEVLQEKFGRGIPSIQDRKSNKFYYRKLLGLAIVSGIITYISIKFCIYFLSKFIENKYVKN